MPNEPHPHDHPPGVHTPLYRLLGGSSQDLIDSVERRLRTTAAPHYRAAEPGLLRERVARLVGAFLEAACNGPEPFVAHVQRLTEERIGEGYYLEEVQLALSALEERAWQLLTQHAEPERLVGQLAFVTGLVGGAKDELARIYFRHKEHADLRAAQLQHKLDELFKGTEQPDDLYLIRG